MDILSCDLEEADSGCASAAAAAPMLLLCCCSSAAAAAAVVYWAMSEGTSDENLGSAAAGLIVMGAEKDC